MIYRKFARLDFWFMCLAVFIGIEALDRLILAVWVLMTRPGYLLPIIKYFPMGVLDDASTAILLGLPFLLGIYLFIRFQRRWFFKAWAHLILFVMCVLLVFTEVIQFYFWNEFNGRLSSIAVNYLLFPREVIGNIRESFDLGLVLPLVAVLGSILYWFLRRPLSKALAAEKVRTERRKMLSIGAVLGTLSAIFLLYVPTNMSDFRLVNEVTINGYQSFMDAALTNNARYKGLYPGMAGKKALPIVRAMVNQDNVRFLKPISQRNLLLRYVDNGNKPKKLNVVLVIEESFGSTYVNSLDNKRSESISPNFDRIARDGLFFTNIYATGNRSVRGLEALLTSFPPIPGVSTTRRPGSKGMNSLAFFLKRRGYKTAFLYGGRAMFDNMERFWLTTGYDNVWDQSDIKYKPFTTIWGAADEYIFTEALKRMDANAKKKSPFFLSIFTVSNHRPYTYPKGRISKDPARKRKENSATYADWAFGNFIDRAKSHPWFDNTVFIFVGDHGPRVNGAAQVPVPSYRVPLLFYSPKYIKPGRVATLGSSADMIPTLLGLMGISYDSPFFGVDLRRVPAGKGRIVMSHNFSVAYGDGHNVTALVPRAKPKGYTMRIGPYELVPRKGGPEASTLKKAIALFQTAHRIFYARQYHELSKPVK
jgi:phosphoglycerol transferase MdoB-like AlkP superfamily enzyme